MTLPEIKAALPKWVALPSTVLQDVYTKRIIIPDEVLENQAFWVLYNRLATVAPASDELGVTFYISRNALREEILRITLLHADLNTRRFLTSLEARKAIPLLGGEQNIIKHLSAGDLYSVWIGEQIGWE